MHNKIIEYKKKINPQLGHRNGWCQLLVKEKIPSQGRDVSPPSLLLSLPLSPPLTLLSPSALPLSPLSLLPLSLSPLVDLEV